MMKYKVGDKVKVREDLQAGKEYNSCYCNEEMTEMAGKIVTIKEANKTRYRLEEYDYNWVDEMFEGLADDPKEPKKRKSKKDDEVISELAKAFNNINNEIKGLSENINKRTMYDDVMQEQIIKKIKEVPLDELTTKVEADVDQYIKTMYGVLPKKIEINNNTTKKEMTGLFHNKFEEILKIVNKGVPLMLTGPAGAGKNHTLEQVAQALSLEFYFTNAITQEYKLTGFIDAGGTYQETQFYKAFKD